MVSRRRRENRCPIMPEGPEIRVSRDTIRRLLIGPRDGASLFASAVGTFGPAHGRFEKNPPANFDEILVRQPMTVINVDSKGKFMWWKLCDSRGSIWWMHGTFGMSGQWLVVDPSLDGMFDKWPKHKAMPFVFSRERAPEKETSGEDASQEKRKEPPKECLCFVDVRHFGTIDFIDDERQHDRKLSTIGPDMLVDPPSVEDFKWRFLKKPQWSLVRMLMSQRFVSGVGNYVKTEALYRARLSPFRSIMTLADDDFVALRAAIIDVMRESYELGGLSIRTFIAPDGTPGKTENIIRVYNKTIDPLGNEIVKTMTDDGRTTYWVPNVQT